MEGFLPLGLAANSCSVLSKLGFDLTNLLILPLGMLLRSSYYV